MDAVLLMSFQAVFCCVLVRFSAVPSKAARDVPALRPYDFAMVQGKLLIVNPSDKKIAEVITG